MSIWLVKSASAIALVTALAFGAVFFSTARRAGGTPEARVEDALPIVTVARPVERELVDWITEAGQFAAVDTVELRARVSGYLTEIHFSEGQIVEKGDLLFVIDPRPYEIALQKATAQYQTALAQSDLAKKQLDRSTALQERNFVSKETHDQRAEQMRAAEAAVEQAKAAIKDARLDLEYCRITAPFAGSIGAKQVSIGALINGGGAPTLLATLVSLDPIYLEFDLSEADYATFRRFSPGSVDGASKIGVEAQLTGESAWSRKGTLIFLDNRLDRGSGTIRARGMFANPGYSITPGQFGRVRVPSSLPHMALLTPDASLFLDQSRKVVMTVADDGRVVSKSIETGPLVDNLRVIHSGVTSTDKIIVDGLMRSRSGNRVATIEKRIETATRSSGEAP